MKTHIAANASKKSKTYVFRVVVEPDEERWSAYCPALAKYGAATWGTTRQEAFRHIREVVELVVEELREDNTDIPHDVRICDEPLVAVSI